MIERNEVLLKSDNQWLHFKDPHRIISATSATDVRAVLQEVEHLVNSKDWHAAGFLSYEAAPAFDSAMQVRNAGDFPLIWFGLYPEPHTIQTYEVLKDLAGLETLSWRPTVQSDEYDAAIEKIKNYIMHGNTYQVNYTMRLISEFSTAAWNFFLNLARAQNKYAAYVDIGRYVICSASPELFFTLDGKKIKSHPMKGTAARGRTTREDQQQAEMLRSSVKNRAENVMIVDMLRNDLGHIAEFGSVHVPELLNIEKYPTLFQMTSEVQAKTSASISDIFSALFPSASITGAPKLSTMNIITEVETSPRKIYTGSIGYMAPKRKAQFNVAIRTALIDRENKSVEYGVGSGIVWDSTSADEYSEALLKARVVAEPTPEFSLLETLLWTPEEGYFLLEKHLERLMNSAEYFSIPFFGTTIKFLLREKHINFSFPQRLRILLDRYGSCTVEAKDLVIEKKIFAVKLGDKPINSADFFYFHKTTYRAIYPPLDGFDDILLYNEKDQLTEFTIGNLVVEMKGKLLTPPISCGLLAGTFRSHLLETGKIEEDIIHKDKLNDCGKIYLVNAVRKWVEVKI